MQAKENLIVSACLLGLSCRYDGKIKEYPSIERLSKHYNLIPVCPEQLGGLPTPRRPVELLNGRAVDKDGRDRTEEFIHGAESALKIALLNHCFKAILKQRSPSCGCGKIYDGTFTGTLREGNGITAQLLLDKGILVINEEEQENLSVL